MKCSYQFIILASCIYSFAFNRISSWLNMCIKFYFCCFLSKVKVHLQNVTCGISSLLLLPYYSIQVVSKQNLMWFYCETCAFIVKLRQDCALQHLIFPIILQYPNLMVHKYVQGGRQFVEKVDAIESMQNHW